jgi:hypothetical protein
MTDIAEVLEQITSEINSLQTEIDELRRNQPTGYMSCGVVRSITVTAGGELTPVYAHYSVLPNSGVTDDVDTVNAERAGRKVTFRTETAGHTITFKDGVDNLNLSGGDIALDDVDKYLTLIYDDENEEWKVYAKGF